MPKGATASDKALVKEYETYRAKLPDLSREEGKYVVIHDEDVAGVYTSYEEALLAGYKKYGLKQPFLVKQILAAEPPVFLR